jgi:hypothetical protein
VARVGRAVAVAVIVIGAVGGWIAYRSMSDYDGALDDRCIVVDQSDGSVGEVVECDGREDGRIVGHSKEADDCEVAPADFPIVAADYRNTYVCIDVDG